MEKCKAFQNNMPQERSSSAKMIAVQKIIKKKFIKAYTNRINHENIVNGAMKPLSHKNRSTSKQTSKIIDSNKLCNQLQKLIDSQMDRNENYSQEIEMIINKLRELEIIS